MEHGFLLRLQPVLTVMVREVGPKYQLTLREDLYKYFRVAQLVIELDK